MLIRCIRLLNLLSIWNEIKFIEDNKIIKVNNYMEYKLMIKILI
jgi:hypothetical protein